MSLTGSNLIDVTFAIDAWGQAAGGVWPHLALKLDGATIGQATVNSSSLGRYTISAKVAADSAHKLQIVYDNDGMAGGADRNLFVRAVSVNGTSIAATDPSVTYDKGAVDGKDVVKGQEALYWGGALNVPLPASLFPAADAADPVTAAPAVTGLCPSHARVIPGPYLPRKGSKLSEPRQFNAHPAPGLSFRQSTG